jgi:hypothetical protein
MLVGGRNVTGVCSLVPLALILDLAGQQRYPRSLAK